MTSNSHRVRSYRFFFCNLYYYLTIYILFWSRPKLKSNKFIGTLFEMCFLSKMVDHEFNTLNQLSTIQSADCSLYFRCFHVVFMYMLETTHWFDRWCGTIHHRHFSVKGGQWSFSSLNQWSNHNWILHFSTSLW